MVCPFDKDTYRCVYLAKFEKALYVLHAFQKKSPSGKKTDDRDVENIKQAFRGAQEHYEKTYEQPKEGK